MNRERIILRDLTKDECPWLDEDIVKGTIVYEYFGYTYGCISNKGIAVTNKLNKIPFFEIPRDASSDI